MSIVSTNVNYGYFLMQQNLTTLIRTYPFLNIRVFDTFESPKSMKAL